MRWFAEHPVVTLATALAGLLIGVLSLVRPEYARFTNGDICGFREVMVPYREHQFKSCTHPNHGITGYQYTETVSASSGWRDGGYDQVAWCNDVKRAKERAVGQSIVWGEEKRRESNRKTFLGHAEYNYSCEIQAKWGPIYAVARSADCGEEPFIQKLQQVPKTCLDESKRIGWKWSWQ